MKIKQLLSGAVAFAMLVTTIPVQAFAVDDTGEATTWTKELSVDELYDAVQDQLDENNAIALEDLTAIEAIASDVRDDVTGQLTAIAFDDQQVVLAELDDTTSYTLTFAEEDNVDATPVEPDAQPSVESDAGKPVTVPDESAANNAPTENPQTTGPPTQSDVSLTVTEEEVFTTEAEAEEQAQEQGVDPAEVSTEIGENGQVLGAMLTVNETEVSKVALVYTANVQNTSDEIMPLSPMSNGETITLSVGDDDDVTGTGGFFTDHHHWEISGNKDIVEITVQKGNWAKITAYQEGSATLIHTYQDWGFPKTETWQVTVQKKEYGTCTFDVYYLIGDELPDPLYGNGEAENYGPSRNDTPMCEVSIDIDTLLEDYYPNGANEGINYNGANTWYITYKTCGTDMDTWWSNVLKCMDEDSQKALQATGLSEIFKGYVLKNQNPDGDYHLDGQLDVQPPVNVVELYLDGEYIGGTAVSEDVEQTTKVELREQYETKFKTEFGEGTANWVEGNIYFQTADKYYRLTESAEPEQSITDNKEVQFTNRSDEHHVARFYLTSSEMRVAYTPTTITIQKTDAETNADLSGARFGLYTDSSCTTKIDEATTNANGQATFTVTAPDTYYVKEISAPEGYVLSDETKTVTVTTTGEPTIVGDTVTFTLSASPASLTFTNEAKPTVQDVLNQFGKKAVADAGVTIPASTFSFTLKQDDNVIDTATAMVTNTDSVVSISAANGTTKLDDGIYTLSENALSAEQAKAGWSKGDTEYTIKIEGGEMTVLGNAADVTTGKYLFTNTYNQPTATLTVRAIDEDGNELSAEGWPTSVPLPIGASYTVTVGMPSGTGDVNVSDEITTAQGDHYIYVGLKDGSELTGQITDDVVVTLVYGLDNIGTEGPDLPDGVLDKYQVLVEFISADERTGTVSGQTQKVYTKIGFVNPDPTENGYINVSADGVTITPAEGYVFAYWTKDDETKETTLPKDRLYVTSDVEKIVFKAHFGEDKIGEEDPNEGDGIADVFQVLVNFEVKNGSWNDGTSDTVQKVFTRKSSGEPSLTGTYTLQDADWPSVGQKPAQGFKAAGSWYEGEYELSLPVKLTQNSLSERTFTFIYEPLGEYELWIEHRYLGGPLDNDRSYPYYDSTNDFGEQFYSTRFDSSEELVLAGTTIQLQELLSDKMDAGYEYDTYAFVTAPGVEDLEINESNPSWEMPEGWMKLVILYVPRTDFKVSYNWSGDIPVGAELPEDSKQYAMGDPVTVDGKYSAATKIEGTKDGIHGTYTFTGWSAKDITITDNQFAMPLSDVILSGSWTFTADNQIIVNYRSNDTDYGTVSVAQQVFTFTADQIAAAQAGTGVLSAKLSAEATETSDGDFDRWTSSDFGTLFPVYRATLDVDVTFTVDQLGKTLEVVANFDRETGGGGAQHPDAGDDDDDDNDRDDDTEEIIDEEVPLAETPWLNTEDHYAYIIGYSEDGTVRPNANITRAEVATIFFRLLTDSARDQFWMTSNNFSDVLPNDWYNNAVSTMVNMGIIQGYEDGTFRPNANITRAEFAAIAARFMASGYGVEDDLFTDIANHWARESINDAAMAGWINGYEDGTFRPDAAITRAEAVTLVNNVLQRKPDADHMLDSMIKWPDNPEGTWYYEAIQEATNSHDYDLFEDAEYETWTALQPNRDWAALEKDWANAHVA